ncbi:pyruvate dehydrogenase (acetyl-transferring) E1 component subunit alpha [Endozoicomonas sp. GU-1]|uniref:pyruvate dehydrogenase (acetyl-transferring) E1 component subunit alpha n=1 Tax=Endozoicomonas sp. GU-1 TaxID=3009078 RepID=UPI0022B32D67|nr:pyruvate dehydrogenase (acetyl-transferring) E1 component subunit alpha [Endozoicomonas sp. GU-1]WBA81596.1 pyruvate dehydrogenase (acetyl-transferring) E1 component subunit alpha [Endozoicomonas sp. GU-1]WBA84549.1 pyruvate dehydrogenase (acetyl-transferring) E1 component subunit alpha [Endozoicomonas sp. GU-1]
MDLTANPALAMEQFLDAEGEVIKRLPAWVSNHDILIDYYRSMVIARQADQKAVALQRTGKMGTYPSCLGQEAISTVCAALLEKEDVLIPYYRDLPGLMRRGIALSDVMLYWGGDERGSASPAWGQDLPNCVPIATQAGHAAGIATAIKIRHEAGDPLQVALCALGDGATSKGDFGEALNLAGAWQLPVVYIINNNQWAISVPRKIQSGAPTLAQKGLAAGLPSYQVDGNDVIALHEVVSAAIDRARQGKGATVIEAVSYRLCDHTTADDASRYRASEELKEAWQQEPIKRLRNFLHHRGVWDEHKEQALKDEADRIIEQAVATYLNTPLPAIEDLFDYHYANMPAQLEQQKNEALAREQMRQENMKSAGGHLNG